MRWFWLFCLVTCSCARREDELIVFAAGSLRDVFSALGPRFTAEHPGVTVRFSFAGTQELRTQLEHGATADVFASADERHMRAITEAGLATAPIELAQNALVVIVRRELAATVTTLEHASAQPRVVVADVAVPVGQYTADALDRLPLAPSLRAHIVSRELSARQVLTRITLGEADVGFTYRTDARSVADAGIGVIELPASAQVVAHYPMAALAQAPHPRLAAQWLRFCRSPPAQGVLRAAGFTAPVPP